MQGVFAHSPDKKFEPKGALTGFPYGKAFNFYKQYFLQAIISGGRKQARILALFAWHNGHIFTDAAGDVAGDRTEPENLCKALDALDFDSDNDEDESGGEGRSSGDGEGGNSAWGGTTFNWGTPRRGTAGSSRAGAWYAPPASQSFPSGPSRGMGTAHGFSTPSASDQEHSEEEEPIPFYEGEGAQVLDNPETRCSSPASARAVDGHSEGAAGDRDPAGNAEVGAAGVAQESGGPGALAAAASQAAPASAPAPAPAPAPTSTPAPAPALAPAPAPAKKGTAAKGKGTKKRVTPAAVQTPMRRGRSAAAGHAANLGGAAGAA